MATIPAAEDFLAPAGRITEDMFPDEDPEERIEPLLSQWGDQVPVILTEEIKQTEWIIHAVYADLFEAAAGIVINRPVAGTLEDQGRVEYNRDQSAQYLKMAERERAAMDALVAAAGTPVAFQFPSGPVATVISYP